MCRRGYRLLFIIVACFISMFIATACAGEKENKDEITEKTNDMTESTTEAVDKGTLVAFFSATGTTKGVAEKLASVTNADLYEIIPKEPYTTEDLDYNAKNTRATQEQSEGTVRPEISSDPILLKNYKTIFIGYPIWWGEEPRILDTFVESYNFEGITLIPFCTSGASGIGNSGKNLEVNAGSGKWLDGLRFTGDVSEEALRVWVKSLNLENS